MTDRYDIAIVGAGIVGLATAYRLHQQRPGLRLAVLDKEPDVGTHQTGHNSGVLHSALTYAPGSLKARLVTEGRTAMERFCDEHAIPYERCGKLVVAATPAEIPRLEALFARGSANGVEGLRLLDPAGCREVEPHVRALRGLHVPTTSILDMQRVARALADALRTDGVDILLGRRVGTIRTRNDGLTIETPAGDLHATFAVACAGLQSDRVATAAGAGDDTQIVPFRGDYAVLRPEARHLVRALIYPVADPALPFLGVHATRRIDGAVWLGPNAVLALARERYRRLAFASEDARAVMRFPGMRHVARRWWRIGLTEQWRDVSIRAFVGACRRFLPELSANDVRWGPVGVRAQLVAADGTMVDDFVVHDAPRMVHVRNAPSPAATASLAIGAEITHRALDRFDAL
jgi:L-2-hydroxyglutarate oxidase LhgO